MHIWQVFVILIACILASVAVAAGTATITGPQTSIAQSCVVQTGPSFTLTNLGVSSNTFGIQIAGSASPYVSSLIPPAVTLAPGQSQAITTQLSIPCGSLGTYELFVKTYDSSGYVAETATKITVETPQNLKITPIRYAADAKACTTANYQYDITNTGSFQEVYSLVFDKEFGRYTNVSFNQVSLNPGQTASLHLAIAPPCSVYGDYTIPFSIQTTYTQLIAKTSLVLNIAPEYGFAAAVGREFFVEGNKSVFVAKDAESAYELCANSIYAVPVKVASTSSGQQTLVAGSKLPVGISLENSELTLNASQESILAYVIDTADTNGNITLPITITNKANGLVYARNISLTVSNCYDAVIQAESGRNKGTVSIESPSIPIKITNTGSRSATYALSVEGQDWIVPAPSSITLGANETKLFDIVATASDDLGRGTYSVLVSATPSGTNSKYAVGFKVKYITLNWLDKILAATAAYAWYIVLGVIVLAAFIAAAIFMVKKAKSRPKKREEKPKKVAVAKQEAKNGQMKQKAPLDKAKLKKLLLAGVITLVIMALGFLIYYYRSPLIGALVSVWDVVSNALTVMYVDYALYIWIGVGVLVLIVLAVILAKLLKRWGVISISLNSIYTQAHLDQRRIAIGEVIVTLKKIYHDSSISFRKIRKPTFLSAGEAVYQYFEGSTQALDNEDIDKIILRFKVRKSWLVRNGVRKQDISLKRYHNKWNFINTQLIGEDEKHAYYESVLDHFTYFAIVGKKSKETAQVAAAKHATVPFSAAEKRIIRSVEKSTAPSVSARDSRKPSRVSGVWLAVAVILMILVAAIWYFWPAIRAAIIMYQWYIFGAIGALIVLAALVILFIMLRKHSNKLRAAHRKVNWKKVFLALLILLFLLFVAAAVIYGPRLMPLVVNQSGNATQSPVAVNQTDDFGEGIPNQRWDEDTVHTIGLSQYFSDPDNDLLKFSNTDLRHIAITYEEGTAVLAPEKDWYGSEYVLFTADDGKGGRVDSNLIKLTVDDVPEQPWYETIIFWK